MLQILKVIIGHFLHVFRCRINCSFPRSVGLSRGRDMFSIRHVTAFNIVHCTFLRVHLCGTPRYSNSFYFHRLSLQETSITSSSRYFTAITITRLDVMYCKFNGCKNDTFQMKHCDLFHMFAQDIKHGYTLERF